MKFITYNHYKLFYSSFTCLNVAYEKIKEKKKIIIKAMWLQICDNPKKILSAYKCCRVWQKVRIYIWIIKCMCNCVCGEDEPLQRGDD